MNIYIHKNEQQLGPFDESQISNALSNGEICLEDLAWKEGLTEWIQLGELLKISQTIPALPTIPQVENADVVKTTRKQRPVILWGGALLILLYIASPYYSMFSLIRSLNEGDTVALKNAVDFPALRESLKDEMKSKLGQQTKRSISSKEEELADKLVSGMGAMFGPAIIDGLVDTFVTPSGLAALIANPSSALDGKKGRNENKIPNISWAFFSGLSKFQAKITEKQETLTLHFRLTDFRWMLYAITWRDKNSANSDVDLLETVKPKKTDSSTAITHVGYWYAEDHPSNFLLQLTGDGEAFIATDKARYKIDSSNVLKIIKNDNEQTIGRISQPNNDLFIISDILGKKPDVKLNRITQIRFTELKDKQIAKNNSEELRPSAQSFYLSILDKNLDNFDKDKPSVFPFDIKSNSASEYISKLIDSDVVDIKTANIIRDNFQIVNISVEDLPETPFLISTDTNKLADGKWIVLFRDGEIKKLNNIDNLTFPKRKTIILPH